MFSILWPIGKYLGMQIHEKLYGFLTVKNEMYMLLDFAIKNQGK